MRLIDADKLKQDDELTLWLSMDAVRAGKTLKMFSELFVKKIDEQPTVTPQQRTGQWLPTSDINKWGYECSECKGIDDTNLGHFCKWCGIKMEVNDIYDS